MKNENYNAFRVLGKRVEGGIYTAVEAWCENQAAAKAQYGPIASWDTSEITDMSHLFFANAGFNEDLSRWDVSNVTSLEHTFDGATSFNGDLSRWDVSNVVHLHATFRLATSFNGDLSCWDVRQVTDMRSMFEGATSFDRQLGGLWPESTARVRTVSFYDFGPPYGASYMFFNCPGGSIEGKTNDATGTPS